MIAISEINDIQRLNRFRLLWKDLYEKTPHVSFFQSLDWLESYWSCYGRGKKLRTLIVSVAAKPIGIVPLVVKPIQTSLGKLRVLTYPLDDWGMFYSPLGPYPAATLAGAMRCPPYLLKIQPQPIKLGDLGCLAVSPQSTNIDW